MKKIPKLIALFLVAFSLVPGRASAQEIFSSRAEALQLINDGDRLMSLANWQDALFAYDAAVTMDPTFATAYMKKANLLAKIGRQQEAMKLYDKAIQLNPYSEYVYDTRAKLKMLAMDY